VSRHGPAILPALCALAIAMLWPTTTRAYGINTGFTDGCHEQITGAAFDRFLLHLPSTEVVVPNSGWRRVARFLVRDLNLDPDLLDDREQFVIMSLVLGVRHPDTDGHSVLSFDHARGLHTDPDPSVQHVHVLRAQGDDGPGGNASVIEGARASIMESLERARDAAWQPADQQRIEARIFVDFYGPVEVKAWAPAFWIGHAAHTLQDSFSHTIRNESDGFRTIATVFNFLDFRPVGVRWRVGPKVTLGLEPLHFALVAPVLTGIPLLDVQYRTTVYLELGPAH
jgi:hypothetical protein